MHNEIDVAYEEKLSRMLDASARAALRLAHRHKALRRARLKVRLGVATPIVEAELAHEFAEAAKRREEQRDAPG